MWMSSIRPEVDQMASKVKEARARARLHLVRFSALCLTTRNMSFSTAKGVCGEGTGRAELGGHARCRRVVVVHVAIGVGHRGDRWPL